MLETTGCAESSTGVFLMLQRSTVANTTALDDLMIDDINKDLFMSLSSIKPVTIDGKVRTFSEVRPFVEKYQSCKSVTKQWSANVDKNVTSKFVVGLLTYIDFYYLSTH